MVSPSQKSVGLPFERATELIHHLCKLAGLPSFLDDIRAQNSDSGISAAISRHDTATIFDWLMTSFSYQGISDQVARNYLAEHGNTSWANIERSLESSQRCTKLRNYWNYSECRYDKGSSTCSQPDFYADCAVPRHRLRNGRLNQTSYSFFLFVRDIAKTDLVHWIDERLRDPTNNHLTSSEIATERQERLIGPLRNVYGVSDKILTMSLSGLLMGAPAYRESWRQTGIGMIAIDTLVHNFLHRTGILHGCGKPHVYGSACYTAGGCASIVRDIAAHIDATSFNNEFPRTFPRFVQHAIWRFCAGDALNVCNGNKIDDRNSCENRFCQLSRKCQKFTLKTQ